LGVLVGGIIVEDHMDRLVGRHFALDGIEKADKFLMPVALHAAADDLALQDIESGEQGGGAVALVVVGSSWRSALFSSADRAGWDQGFEFASTRTRGFFGPRQGRRKDGFLGGRRKAPARKERGGGGAFPERRSAGGAGRQRGLPEPVCNGAVQLFSAA